MAAWAASTATGSGRSGAGPLAVRGARRGPPRLPAPLGGLAGLEPRARDAGPGGAAGSHPDIVAAPGRRAPHPDGVMGAPGRPDRKVDPVAAAAPAPRAAARHVVCVKTGARGEHAPVLSHYRKGLI